VFSRTNGNTEENHGRTFILEELARDSELSATRLYNIDLVWPVAALLQGELPWTEEYEMPTSTKIKHIISLCTSVHGLAAW
jgi:hypothetical protein